MFDICILGHITQDRVTRIDGTKKTGAGGTAYYVPIALSSLGARSLVITKLARNEWHFLDMLLERDIGVRATESPQTTVFENVYVGSGLRRQWIGDIAQPFTLDDVQDVEASVFHLGPLTPRDMPLEILEYLARRSKISLDVQGFVRRCVAPAENGKPLEEIEVVDWPEKRKGLSSVNILKADEHEAGVLSEEGDLRGKEDFEKAAKKLSKLGPTEVIITCADKGSLVYCRGESCWFPSYRQEQPLYPTGCGDTYMAGYLFQKLKSGDFLRAGRFAAGIASLTLRAFDPFKGTEEDVWQFLEEQSDTAYES